MLRKHHLFISATLVMTTTSSRSHSSKPSRSRSHSVVHRSRSRPSSRSHTAAPVKSKRKHASGSRKRGSADSLSFYCMRCKDHIKSPVNEYVTEKWGNREATMAKGVCRKCDCKMSLIVGSGAHGTTVGHSRSKSKSRSKSSSPGPGLGSRSRRKASASRSR